MVKRIFLLCLVSFSLFAQDFKATLKTDSLNYTVGDVINLTVTVKHPNTVKLFFPPVLDSLKSLEFVKNDTLITKEENGQITSTKLYKLMGFDSARVTVGPFTFTGQNGNQPVTVITDSLSLFVATVAVDTSAQLKSIKEPIEIPIDKLLIAAIAGGILLLAGLIYLIYRKWKNRDIPVEVYRDTRTPLEKALDRLAVLKKTDLLSKGEFKQYYIELTELLREFYERVYGVKALEETSGELIAELKKIDELREFIRETEALLEYADMVKFAKFIPLESRAVNDTSAAEGLIKAVWNKHAGPGK